MKKRKNVSSEATWNKEDEQWELGEKNENGKETKGKYVGDYFVWDMNGTLVMKRVYDPKTGDAIEEHQYKGGVLRMSKVLINEEIVIKKY